MSRPAGPAQGPPRAGAGGAPPPAAQRPPGGRPQRPSAQHAPAIAVLAAAHRQTLTLCPPLAMTRSASRPVLLLVRRGWLPWTRCEGPDRSVRCRLRVLPTCSQHPGMLLVSRASWPFRTQCHAQQRLYSGPGWPSEPLRAKPSKMAGTGGGPPRALQEGEGRSGRLARLHQRFPPDSRLI